jgi:hypothetical protein
MRYATILIKPAKQPLAPQFGIAGYPISNLLFFNSSGNLPNASTKILKLNFKYGFHLNHGT